MIDFRELKINKKSFVYRIIMWMVILFDYHFFYLFEYSGLLSNFKGLNMYVNLGLLSVLLTIFIYKLHPSILKKYSGWLKGYCIFVGCAFVLLFLYSKFTYGESSVIILRVGTRFLYPLFAVPFIYIFEIDGGYDKFFKQLNCFSFAWFVYILVQSIYFSTSGKLLFEFESVYAYSSRILVRNGLRAGTGCFGMLTILYNFYELINCKKIRVFNLVQVILGLYCVLCIEQTRVAILICAICTSYSLLLIKKKTRKLFLAIFAIMGISIFLYVNPGIISEFIGSFAIESDKGLSTSSRLYAISYYWGVFLRNPLFGFGWPSDDYFYSIIHGPMGLAFQSDVGVFGLMADCGILGLILFFVPWFRMFKISRTSPKGDFLTKVICLYVLLSSSTLIITDGGRCLAFPLLIACYEYYYQRNRVSKVNY